MNKHQLILAHSNRKKDEKIAEEGNEKCTINMIEIKGGDKNSGAIVVFGGKADKKLKKEQKQMGKESK